MAPRKKKDTYPKTSSEKSAQHLGFRLSPAKTPKKLLRNKKRKELIESLSPSPSPKKKPRSSSKRSSNSPTKKSAAVASASANTPSILSFFAKAKPVEYVECPVCSAQVPMSKINRHLDNNCLVDEEAQSGSSGLSNNSTGSTCCSKDVESKPPSMAKTKPQFSQGRKTADLKNESKDKRTRLKLKKKMKSHALYRETTSINVEDSSDSVVTVSETSQDQSDTDFVADVRNQSDVEIAASVKPKKTVHRELFGGSNINNNKSTSSKRTRSKLSLKRKSTVEKDMALAASLSKKQVQTGASIVSSYWSLSSTASSSDDCVIVRGAPAKEQLSLSQKISSQLSPAKNKTEIQSQTCISESSPNVAVSGTLKQRTPCSSSGSKSRYHGAGHQENVNRTEKKPFPVRSQKKLSPPKIDGKMPKHSRCSSSSGITSHTASSTCSNLPTTKPASSSVHRLPQVSPNKVLQHSPASKNKLGGSPAKGGVHSPSTSRALYSPNRHQPSTSMHTTPVNSPLKSSQTLSPAPSSTSSMNSPSKRDPYYLANFKLIFLTVLGHEDDKSLFSDEDLASVDAFKNLSGPAQQLYVRLFLRKHAWLRAAKLDYPKIATDLTPAISELQAVNLLLSEKELNDIEEALNLLPAPDVKSLAKSLRVGAGGSTQKSELVRALLKHARQQRSIFNAVNMQQIVMKKTRNLLGSCVKLHSEPRTVFSRIMLLFSLAVSMEEEDQASGGQIQMQTLLMVNMGRVTYPAYTIFRTRKIFRCRDDLIRYEEANQYEQDIQAALGTNDFGLALQIQQAAKERFERIKEDDEISRHNLSLPPFLRHFTASWMYTRILYLGVEIQQKMRCYGLAVAGLRALLAQTEYCMDSRGRWWDRLALNLDQHLKKPSEALDVILAGLADPYVKTGHNLALQQRAQKIFKSQRNKKLLDRQEEFTFDDIRELPKVTIQGQVLPFQAPGVKNTFVRRLQASPSKQDDGDMAICSVEQVALQHYKESGFEEGVHGEGSVFSTLIFLLFWDVIFMEGIPDVFSYPYQSAPLDIRYSAFYECRQETIDEKLHVISIAENSALQTALESKWKEHEGEAAIGVSWELFNDVEHAKGLLSCIGGKTLSAIAARILKNHRHTRAGMPDLTVWSTKTNKYKVVEVKGPGDRLSQKQILWLDYLLGVGVDAEVCHVQASGKRLRIT